jgi:hypothetical protein
MSAANLACLMTFGAHLRTLIQDVNCMLSPTRKKQKMEQQKGKKGTEPIMKTLLATVNHTLLKWLTTA